MTDADESTELKECPVCGALGLPERIEEHDCREFYRVVLGP
jgi:hypothetical protein